MKLVPLKLPEIATRLPLYQSPVSAGFPSVAFDYVEQKLDLSELLIKHPAATYFCRVAGNSMKDAGIYDQDILIVDRSLIAEQMNVVIATVDDQFVCKYLDINMKQLLPANEKYAPIPIHEEMSVIIEGVVTYSIRKHRAP